MGLEQFFDALRISDYDHEMWYGEEKVAKDMKLQQLDKKFFCGLKSLNISNSNSSGSGNFPVFKYKDYEVKTNPEWPAFFSFIKEVKLEALGLTNCKLNHKCIELYASAIGSKPTECKHLLVLNLAHNPITKEGARILAPALEENKSIQTLDLSHTQLGVYGVTLIAKSLQKNNTVKTLNLFKNTIDVDGARAIRDMLKVNSSIEFLDIGHNRIREKGLEAITEGLKAGKSNVKTLGLRLNFINDDGINKFFSEIIL